MTDDRDDHRKSPYRSTGGYIYPSLARIGMQKILVIWSSKPKNVSTMRSDLMTIGVKIWSSLVIKEKGGIYG